LKNIDQLGENNQVDKDNSMKEKLKPPNLQYIPTPELMREQIIRACYIKDVNKFIKDNTYVEVDLIKEFELSANNV